MGEKKSKQERFGLNVRFLKLTCFCIQAKSVSNFTIIQFQLIILLILPLMNLVGFYSLLGESGISIFLLVTLLIDSTIRFATEMD